MEQEKQILRELAFRYAEAARHPSHDQQRTLYRASNDLSPIRPIVLIREVPWNELETHPDLVLRCTDPDYREAEQYFRRHLFQWKYFPADMVLDPYYGVSKIIESTGFGLTVQETTLGDLNSIHSHAYQNQLDSEEALEKLHFEKITYRKEETYALYHKMSDAIGDILPVKITGAPTGYSLGCRNWDIATELIGPENVFYQLADEPELMHKIAEKLTDIFLDKVRQYEELDLFEPDQVLIHHTPALNSTTPGISETGKITAKQMWGRGLAQIFASVSKEMRNEFDITYMKRAMEPFGLVYYGCCEPLHNMIDILEQIPHLRKISITPWADVDISAEAIGKKYVLASKPNPAFLLNAAAEPEPARKELCRILDAVKRNGCACDIVLKDISSIGGSLENLVSWERIAMELVLES